MGAELTIGVVDDDADQRSTIQKQLSRNLEGTGARVMDSPPFPDLQAYLEWIRKENIGALVIDWRLNERGTDADPVTYEGDSVVSLVHQQLPFFPIFVVTAYADDDDVKAEGGSVEQIVNRGEFAEKASELAQRFLRAAGRFTALQEEKLARLSELANRAASGTATAEDVIELRALQQELRLACEGEVLTDGELLAATDAAQDEARELLKRIEQALGDG